MSINVVSLSERCELSLCEREVKHREHGAELRDSDLTLTEFVKVAEELLDSHTFHNN